MRIASGAVLRTFLLPFFCLTSLAAALGQYAVVASEVESWITPDFPSGDFNLNSSYLYLVNGQNLQRVFEGEGLQSKERKEVGLHKGDYPQYMYLAISIKDPVQEGNTLSIPLMIHDMRNPNMNSRLIEYGGRFLENIPDDILKNGDIVAKVRFEAIKTNTTTEFWKKTAEISVELGKTATSLLKTSLAGPFLALTEQIIPQIDKGLRSMEKVEDPVKITSEFYIKLLSKELSNLYAERVVSATLYRIHWDIDKVPRTRFFSTANPKKVDDLRALITNTTTPYFLVVNTKSEYNTDHSELVYNQSYIDKKSKDFRKIQNPEKKETEQQFLETLKRAVELKRQIELFQTSLNTKYIDWLAYSRIIDLYYDIRYTRNQEVSRLSGLQDAITRDKYVRLYANVVNDSDGWLSTELLSKGKEVVLYLINHPGTHIADKNDPRALYRQIELLDFFRDRVKQMEIQGKLPREIEALGTYDRAIKKLELLENALFELDFQPEDRLSLEAKKEWLYQRASNVYPLCTTCAKRVGERITAIENATFEQNQKKFRSYVTEYYDQLECFDEVMASLDQFIRVNTDSATVSPLVFESIRQDRTDLMGLSHAFVKIFAKDYNTVPPAELSGLIQQYQLNREKFLVIIQRLRGKVLPIEGLPCALRP